MQFVGIDLAERMSAVVAVDENGTPFYEATLDTGKKENVPNPFAKAKLLHPWVEDMLAHVGTKDEEAIFVIEDIAPHMMDPKPVLKLQGALIGFLTLHGIEAHLITAQVWQKDFGYVSKKQHGDSKKWAMAQCEARGYVAGQTLPPGTKILAKPKTDLRDAYLLAEWLRGVCLG